MESSIVDLHLPAMTSFNFPSIFLVFVILPMLNTSRVIRVGARQYVPLMHQHYNGTFTDGIEFHLIQAIAEKLSMQLESSDLRIEITRINTK